VGASVAAVAPDAASHQLWVVIAPRQ
jgi:hypothetical protein